jgi:hypothetical protein
MCSLVDFSQEDREDQEDSKTAVSPAAGGHEREAKYPAGESPEGAVAFSRGILCLTHPAGLRPAVGSLHICDHLRHLRIFSYSVLTPAVLICGLLAMAREFERLIDNPLERGGARTDAARLAVELAANPEQLVGDVERCQHGKTERVGRRRGIGGEVHAPIDVGREFLDVARIERRPNRITLAVNLDVDDSGLGHRDPL